MKAPRFCAAVSLLAALVILTAMASSQSLTSRTAMAQPKRISGATSMNPRVFASLQWDSTHQLFAESLTAGKDGMLYAGISDSLFTGLCYVARFLPNGKQQVLATVPAVICANGFLLGVAFDEDNRLHVAFFTSAPGANPGVYRVEPNGSLTLAFRLPPDSFPNGIAFYGDDLYVSDSFKGAIWRKGPHDSPVATTPWYQDSTLLAPYGFGANGIAFYRNSLFVAVADAGSIVRIAIQHDGSPSAWQYAAPPDSRLATIDGIAFDVTGRLWFTVNYGSDGAGGKLGTLDENGTVSILADSPGWLDYPTQVVFGSKPYNRNTLYLSNAGLLGGVPNILSFDVGVAGIPLPADRY